MSGGGIGGEGRVYVLSSLREGTGNAAYASRLGTFWEGSVLLDAGGEGAEVRVPSDARCVIGVHAWRAGRHLVAEGEESPRFVLVLSGTDVGSYLEDDSEAGEVRKATMRRAVQRASAVVVLARHQVDRAMMLFDGGVMGSGRGADRDKVVCIRQGVQVGGGAGGGGGRGGGGEGGDGEEMEEMEGGEEMEKLEMGRRGEEGRRIRLVWVGGVREVKDPMFLLDMLKGDGGEVDGVSVTLIGPPLDEALSERVARVCAEQGKGRLEYVGLKRRADVLEEIRKADFLVNSSLSEGSPGAVLEAMALHTPTILRKRPWSAQFEATPPIALFFHDRATLLEILATTTPSTRESIAANAKAFIDTHFHPRRERHQWTQLLDKVAPPS